MEISSNTNIAKIIKENKQAIDVISTINPHFKKLKNPILRKLLASMVTVEQAAKIGGVPSSVILNKLAEIGFTIMENPMQENSEDSNTFSFQVNRNKLFTLDVRPYIQKEEDPFAIIMKGIKQLPSDYTFLLINSFEPVPLISLLKKKGYEAYVKKINNELYETYFQRIHEHETETLTNQGTSFDDILKQHNSIFVELDVRGLEMPEPMVLILNKLTTLENNQCLLVRHHKIPVILFSKLDELQLIYAYKQAHDGDIWILIARK